MQFAMRENEDVYLLVCHGLREHSTDFSLAILEDQTHHSLAHEAAPSPNTSPFLIPIILIHHLCHETEYNLNTVALAYTAAVTFCCKKRRMCECYFGNQTDEPSTVFMMLMLNESEKVQLDEHESDRRAATQQKQRLMVTNQ
jgi:hypothetical protein